MESKKHKTVEDYPPFDGEVNPLTYFDLQFSDNQRIFRFFRQIVKDGIDLKLVLYIDENLPSFKVDIPFKSEKPKTIFLLSTVENFILHYLHTGSNTGIPSYPQNGESITFRAEGDYLYRHLKRELLRNKYIYKQESENGIDGCYIISEYPYGTIDYGFIPHTFEELKNILEEVEPFPFHVDEEDIQRLSTAVLPIDEISLQEGQTLDSVLNPLPSNVIIDKTICGCGATWTEIHSHRNSIIIEPNVPVIIGKQKKHPQVIGVYGDKIGIEDIKKSILEATGDIKLMTTPDSFSKMIKALKALHIDFYSDYFLLFDECEKIVSDIDYRSKISLPLDDFFKFKNKAMVSATPIIVDDPRFTEQGFKVKKIKPAYDYKQNLELIPTNNVQTTLREILKKVSTELPIFIFYNSVEGIKEMIDFLGIDEQANIYCSTEGVKELVKEGYKKNVYDNLLDGDGNNTFNIYNFLTSRFYSALDIELDFKPVVIMISQVFKRLPEQTPYALIDTQTEAVQIAGRFRKGIDKLIHITNTNPGLGYQNRKELEQFLKEQHNGYIKLDALHKQAKDSGEKHIIFQAIRRTDYVQNGYVTDKGKINYFRYNNAYLDERLKSLYRYPARLYKAYKESGAFNVFSESMYSAYTDDDRNKLKNSNKPKAERIQLLYEIYYRLVNSEDYFDLEFLNEIKMIFHYSLRLSSLLDIKG